MPTFAAFNEDTDVFLLTEDFPKIILDCLINLLSVFVLGG